MRLYRALPFIVALVLLGTTAIATVLAFRATGPGSNAATTMMERWLRRDATAGVEVYPGILPPALDEMLNRDATSLRDRITLPIAPGARLIGSSYVHEPDGDLVSVMYDIDGDIGTIAQAITDQMNKAPWTVFGGDGEETLRTVQFGNTQVAGVQGRAIIELNPNPQDYRLTVSRDGRDTMLTVRRTARTSTVGATMQPNLTVQRVDPGPTSRAGLRLGDRIVKINDTPVTNPQELAVAMQAMAHSGPPRAALTYFVAAAAAGAPAPEPFITPKTALALPSTFPAPAAWRGLTVISYAWGPQQSGGLGFEASMASKSPSATVMSQVRDGLAAAGWQVTAAPAQQAGVTQLQITKTDQGLSGQVAIAPNPDDSAYIQVVLQIQGG